MKDLVKKSLLVGLGAASLTKSKAEKVIKGFVKKKAITAKDAKAVLNSVIKEAEKQRSKLIGVGKTKGSQLKKEALKMGKELEKLGRINAKKIVKLIEKELK